MKINHLGAGNIICLVLCFFLALLWIGCPLAHDEYQPNECYSGGDCFAQDGEYCDLPPQTSLKQEPGVCRIKQDASVKLKDMRAHSPEGSPSSDANIDGLGDFDIGGDMDSKLDSVVDVFGSDKE